MPPEPSWEKFVGFYWTFGDTRPPSTDAELGTLSFTVREQRRMVEEEVRALGGRLLLNFAYQERAHRPTAAISGAVRNALRECERLNAALIYVDFSDIAKWRPHQFYDDALTTLKRSSLAVPVGDTERPKSYFALHRGWTSPPHRHPARAVSTRGEFNAILSWQIADMGLPESTPPRELARRLNQRGFRTFKGLRWSEANARHAMRALIEDGLWPEPSVLAQARRLDGDWAS